MPTASRKSHGHGHGYRGHSRDRDRGGERGERVEGFDMQRQGHGDMGIHRRHRESLDPRACRDGGPRMKEDPRFDGGGPNNDTCHSRRCCSQDAISSSTNHFSPGKEKHAQTHAQAACYCACGPPDRHLEHRYNEHDMPFHYHCAQTLLRTHAFQDGYPETSIHYSSCCTCGTCLPCSPKLPVGDCTTNIEYLVFGREVDLEMLELHRKSAEGRSRDMYRRWMGELRGEERRRVGRRYDRKRERLRGEYKGERKDLVEFWSGRIGKAGGGKDRAREEKGQLKVKDNKRGKGSSSRVISLCYCKCACHGDSTDFTPEPSTRKDTSYPRNQETPQENKMQGTHDLTEFEKAIQESKKTYMAEEAARGSSRLDAETSTSTSTSTTTTTTTIKATRTKSSWTKDLDWRDHSEIRILGEVIGDFAHRLRVLLRECEEEEEIQGRTVEPRGSEASNNNNNLGGLELDLNSRESEAGSFEADPPGMPKGNKATQTPNPDTTTPHSGDKRRQPNSPPPLPPTTTTTATTTKSTPPTETKTHASELADRKLAEKLQQKFCNEAGMKGVDGLLTGSNSNRYSKSVSFADGGAGGAGGECKAKARTETKIEIGPGSSGSGSRGNGNGNKNGDSMVDVDEAGWEDVHDIFSSSS
ncbi:MAG: hypothetical protein M1834_001289 [Cirrosporium novae-zelandiae]|nr:MAG: hypothetical protein M1834_001289 [Cirrosporium novae-zelandiae]